MTPRDPQRTAAFVHKIRDLSSLVREHRDAMDRDRRLPEPVFDALVQADLFRLWMPKALGGPELSPLDFMDVVEAAAALDGSVGWIVGNGAGMSRSAGYLPEETARRWFVEPRTFVASATGAVGAAVPVQGGYRVTGRWPFGSGIHHATRVMGLCSVAAANDEAAPTTICCYLAATDVSITDTWHVSGLRGTGSCDFGAQDVFVPLAHTHVLLDHRAPQPGLLYRMPPLSVFAWTVAVVPLGIARSAITSFAALASRKVRAGTTLPLGERETVHADVGRAEATLRAARAFLVEAINELMICTDVGGERLVSARVLFRVACAHAAESALQVVDRLAAAAGAAAIFETCALERQVRDVHAAVKHVAMSPNSYVVAGRLGLGLEPGTTRF